MMQKYPGRIEAFYGVEPSEDLEEVIDNIALKKNIFKKGHVIDRARMARLILADWHKGNIII
jgi:ribosome biogenesis GTPase A